MNYISTKNRYPIQGQYLTIKYSYHLLRKFISEPIKTLQNIIFRTRQIINYQKFKIQPQTSHNIRHLIRAPPLLQTILEIITGPISSIKPSKTNDPNHLAKADQHLPPQNKTRIPTKHIRWRASDKWPTLSLRPSRLEMRIDLSIGGNGLIISYAMQKERDVPRGELVTAFFGLPVPLL